MFGIFTKTNLTNSERAALMLSIIHGCLMGISKHNTWLSAEHRAEGIEVWLKRNNRKASRAFRVKLSAAADELTRIIVATEGREGAAVLAKLLAEAQVTKPGTVPHIDLFLQTWMGECERTLVKKGLAS